MSAVPGEETLAIDGGSRVRTDPWPPRRVFGEEEKQAAARLFDESIQTGVAFGYGGAEETAFCEEFAEELGGGYADGVNSGSNAVYVALRALELEPFTEVIVPPISDPGGFMPVPLMNCIPVSADGAPGSYNTDAQRIGERLTDRTSAIVVAHIAGIPVEMDPILDLARERDIPVVEDCAQAHGATYKGRRVGTLGDIAAFSTMSGKHVVTGGQGGVVFTRSEELYWKARRMADRGKPFGMEGASGNVAASLNCNMDELHAAIGRVQLEKLGGVVERRRRLAAAIEEGCKERLSAVRLVGDPPHGESSYWFLFFGLDLGRIAVGKERFVEALAAEGVPVGASYMHCMALSPWYRERAVFGRNGMPWPAGERREYDMSGIVATDARHFRMDFHENLGEQEIEDTLAALEKVERAYLKG
jgi:perosamine synthetase